MRVHITFPFFPEAESLLRSNNFDLSIHPRSTPEPRDELIENARSSDGLICTLFDKIDRAFFESVFQKCATPPKLKAVGQFEVGYDNIDIKAATEFKVQVTNTPDVLTDATAEMALLLMLAAARRVGEGERLVRAGKWTGWEPHQMLGHSVT